MPYSGLFLTSVNCYKKGLDLRKESAIILMQEIEKLCEGNRAYCHITFEKKPLLTGIRMEVIMKLDAPECVKIPAEGNGTRVA